MCSGRQLTIAVAEAFDARNDGLRRKTVTVLVAVCVYVHVGGSVACMQQAMLSKPDPSRLKAGRERYDNHL